MFYYLYSLLFQEGGSLSFLRIFRYITVRAVLAAITAFVTSLLFGKLVINQLNSLSFRENIYQDGPKEHLKKKGTPTMGGLLILISILVPTFLWGNLGNRLIWICILSTIFLGILGFIDDYLKLIRSDNKGLSVKVKLWGQVALGLAVAVYLYLNPLHIGQLWRYATGNDYTPFVTTDFMTKLSFPFFKYLLVELGVLYIPLVIIVIVGTSNAVNLTDGLDGLAVGCVMFAAGTLTVFCYLIGNWRFSQYLNIFFVEGSGELTVFCAAIMGACLGFLWFNAFPAQIFMGDTGSLALGGALGVVSVLIKKEVWLLFIGGIFVMEALSVILQVASYRYRDRKRIFRMAPLHHHFELGGIEESKIVIRFWIVAIILSLFSLMTLKVR